MTHNPSLAEHAFMQFPMADAEKQKTLLMLTRTMANAANKQNANTQTKSTNTTATKTTSTTSQNKQTKQNTFDDNLFLEGFNSARDRDWRQEQQSRMKKLGSLGMLPERMGISIAQKAPVQKQNTSTVQQQTSDKLTPEDEKAFLEGFNKYRDEDKAEQAKLEKVRAAYDTSKTENVDNKDANDILAEVADIGVRASKWALNPLENTAFEYRNRNAIHSDANSSVRAVQNGWGRTSEPLGSFGIVSKGTSDVADVNGKPAVNYMFGFDTKYIDQNGKLQTSTVPQWVFNRDSIKQSNAETIDKFTGSLTSKLPQKQGAVLSEAAERLKQRNAAMVDSSATKVETWLNGVDEASGKTRINKGIANIADDIPEILDSKALKAGGKALSAAGTALNVIQIGSAMYQDYKEDETIGYETVKTAVGVAGETAVSAVGAKAGAWLGAAIGGAISGGVLSVPLAAIGGLVGGYLGGKLGEHLGKKLVEENTEYFYS